MDITVKGNQKLNGTINGITSKSDAHRILICASLCKEETTVLIHDLNKDLEATIDCLRGMGCDIAINPDLNTVKVTPQAFTEPC